MNLSSIAWFQALYIELGKVEFRGLSRTGLNLDSNNTNYMYTDEI